MQSIIRTSAPLGHGENSCPVQYFYKPEVRQRVTLPPTLRTQIRSNLDPP